MSEVCNFTHFCHCSKRIEMVDQCYSSITAQSFIRQAKESTPLAETWGRATSKDRLTLLLASSFYSFAPLPLEPAPMQTGLAKNGACLFPLKFSSGSWIFFCTIFCRFFLYLSFSHHYCGLLSLFQLPNFPFSRDGRHNPVGIRASRSLGYLLLIWDGKGHWASPLASVKPQVLMVVSI